MKLKKVALPFPKMIIEFETHSEYVEKGKDIEIMLKYFRR